MNTFGPISPVFLIEPSESFRRLILFDPTRIYERCNLFDHYKRNNYIGMDHLFLQPDLSICACGCGEALTGRRTRYASNDCKNFAVRVYLIFRGDSDLIKRTMFHYLPHQCVSCGCDDYLIEKKKIVTWGERTFENTSYSASGLHVEHILAIKDGGGGCWLGNFQFMCHRCHGAKTATEKQLRNRMPAISPSQLF